MKSCRAPPGVISAFYTIIWNFMETLEKRSKYVRANTANEYCNRFESEPEMKQKFLRALK